MTVLEAGDFGEGDFDPHGMNPVAVEHMTQVAGGWGRIVWMSTFDAENQVRDSKENRPFVAVSKNGRLLPEALQVIALARR